MTNSESHGFIVWLTGLPASGKTTIAHFMQKQLANEGIKTIVIDSDQMRKILTPDPTYDDAERSWFYRALTDLALWLAQNELNVLIAATANRRAYRVPIRQRAEHYAEVFVKCDLEICIQRDPKGIYARALRDETRTVPGMGSPYEAPFTPEVIIDSGEYPAETAATIVISELRASGTILS